MLKYLDSNKVITYAGFIVCVHDILFPNLAWLNAFAKYWYQTKKLDFQSLDRAKFSTLKKTT